jgi:hypothetical protein
MLRAIATSAPATSHTQLRTLKAIPSRRCAPPMRTNQNIQDYLNLDAHAQVDARIAAWPRFPARLRLFACQRIPFVPALRW